MFLRFWVEVRGGWVFIFIFVTEAEKNSPEGCSAERIVPIPGSVSQADIVFCFPDQKQWWLTTSAAPGRVGDTGHAVGSQEAACGLGGDASWQSHPATANYAGQANSNVKDSGDTDHHWWFNLNSSMWATSWALWVTHKYITIAWGPEIKNHEIISSDWKIKPWSHVNLCRDCVSGFRLCQESLICYL